MRVAVLVACIVTIGLVLPAGQASAQSVPAGGSARAFSLFRMDGALHEVGRWDPCRPIGYRVNAAQGTRGSIRDVKEAIRRVSTATGLRFVYRGRTTRIPQAVWSDHAYPADTQLIVAWTRPSQSTLWQSGDGGGSVAGLGGAWHLPARDVAGRPWGRYDHGYVLLNAGVRLPAGFAARGSVGPRGRELMHELGHVVGLDHPRQGGSQQIMYPVLTRKAARWGAGDLAGLKIVGARGGCLVDTP